MIDLAEIAYNLLQGNIDLTETDYLALGKFKGTFRKLIARGTDITSKRQLLNKHCTAVKELVFLNYNSKISDSSDDTDSEDIFSEVSDADIASDLQEHSVKYDGPEFCAKTNSDTNDALSAVTASTVKEQPVRCDVSAKHSPASETGY